MTINNTRRLGRTSKGERMDRLLATRSPRRSPAARPRLYAAEAAAPMPRRPRSADDRRHRRARRLWREGRPARRPRPPTDIRNIPQALTIVSKAQIEDQQLRSVGDLLHVRSRRLLQFGRGQSRHDRAARQFEHRRLLRRWGARRRPIFPRLLQRRPGRGAERPQRDDLRPRRRRRDRQPGAQAPELQRRAQRDRLGRRLGAHGGSPATSTSRCRARVGVRLNGLYEDGDSFRRHVDLKRYGINPTAALLAGPDTRIDLSYEYFHDRRTADRGVPANGDEPLRGLHARPSSAIPDKSFAKADVNLATRRGRAPVRRRPDAEEPDAVRRLRQILPEHLPEQLQRRDRPGGAVGATTTATTAGTCSARPTSSGKTGSAGIDQTLLFGFELGREQVAQQAHDRHASSAATSVPISDPTVDADVVFAPSPSDADNRVTADVAALYVQDQIRPAEWLEIVAGLRFDSFKVARRRPARSRRRASAAATICGRRASGWSSSRPTICRSTRATAARICRNRATSSAASTYDHRRAEARAVRQLRGRREAAAARRPARDRGHLPARPHQHPRDRSAQPDAHRADRRAAQPRARARARAQRHQPLADLGRLCAAEGGDHRDDRGRAEGPRSPAGAAPQLLAVEPLRFHQADRRGARRDRAVEILRVDQQCGEAARLRARRCGALLQAAATASRRRSTSRICSARIISRPRTPTTISRPARRGR